MNFKLFTNFKIFFLALLPVILIATGVKAFIGFQASLEPYPFFISGFEDSEDRFSAAIYPKSISYLSQKLIRKPKHVSSDFETHSHNFETIYYQNGKIKKSLVPLSLDADRYLEYKFISENEKYFSNIFSKSFADPERKKGRRGIGFNVNLPKRFDKIFGEGGAGLQVSGYRRISFSGRSRWTDASASDAFQQSKFPTLNMEQISRFEITGTIGSKITVHVAQDSQTDIPLANRLQIRYKGDDDDILKAIEAGNTNLSIPNTRFVGYNQHIQGLFGLKAVAQVGNLTLTAIASQEKGSSERKVFNPTGGSGAEYIRDYQFVKNRIFDLAYTDPEILGRPDPYEKGDEIVRLVVYEQIKTTGRDDENYSTSFDAIIYPEPTFDDKDSFFLATDRQTIKVQEITSDNYVYEFLGNTPVPYIVFKSPRTESRTLAFYMEFIDATNGDTVKVGDISQETSDTLILKTLALNSTINRESKSSWNLMWRNCYQIPRGVRAEDIDLKIYIGENGTEATNQEKHYSQTINGKEMDFLEIFGLDQFNLKGERIPDGVLDDRSEVFRDDWGLIIFPSRKPFNSDTTFSLENKITQELDQKVPEIYDNTTNSQTLLSKSKYYLQLATRSRSSIISLNQANIIEGSERVTVNGRQLKRDTDYRINYDFGQITLQSPEALDPNADISIDFEYTPFLSLQKKTLLGARAEYKLSNDISFGSTALYKSDKAQERKPRVGQETANMVVLDFDASAKFQPNFLTDLANALPFVETETPSNFQISGEIAQSHPNPNVDNVAYVDDFESALDQLSLGMVRTSWQLASVPRQIELKQTEEGSVYQRGKLLWHRPVLGSETVLLEDVYDREIRQGEGGILQTFRMIYTPDNIKRTIDTIYTETDTVIVEDTVQTSSWAGITRYFRSVDSKRVQLFEFRARMNEGAKGKLHFDFGEINEDVDIYTKHAENPFTEDGFDYDGTNNNIADNNVDPNEDVGIDGIPDTLEVDESGNQYNAQTNPDPGGDNWFYLGEGKCPLPGDSCQYFDEENDPLWTVPQFRYRWLNGTEGNRKDASVLGEPDREQLSDNGHNITNAYFSYAVDLEGSPFAVDSSFKNGWMTYRIPIRNHEITDTLMSQGISDLPSWDRITHVRVWFESDETQTTPDTVEIANWYFVQSNWQDTVILSPLSREQTSFTAATISSEDGTFRAPPGVEAYKDPAYNVEEPQRGLMLRFDSLQYLDTAMVTKELIQIEQYSGYRKMKMYVNVPYLTESADSVKFFFRIGRDLKNYYEHSTYLEYSSNWDQKNWVEIDFADLTQIKDSVIREEGRITSVNVSSGKYRIIGSPNLNEVRFFSAGVVNTKSSHAGVDTADVSGEIWLDELRVTDVRRDVGSAARISANGSVADLITYNFSYQFKDPYFRGISAATRGGSDQNLGSGKTEKSVTYGFGFNFDKLLPRSWNAKLPFRYSYTKQTLIPLLRNGTDILMPEAVRQEEQTISTSQSFSVTGISFKHKGNNPLFNYLLNRLRNTSFSYRMSNRSDVLTPYQYSENINISSGLDMSWKKPPTVPIFFWTKWIPIAKKTANSRLGLYPTKFTIDGVFDRNIALTDNNDNQRRTTFKRNFTGTVDVAYSVFENLTTGFKYTTIRDLSDIEKLNLSFKDPKIGLETRFQHNFTSSYDPKLISFFTTTFSYSANYVEDYDKSYASYRSSLTRNMSVDGVFDHNILFGQKSGKSGGDRRFKGRKGQQGQKKEDMNKKAGPPFYDKPLSVLRFLTGWINPFKYRYDLSYRNSLPGIRTRPPWAYRLGFTRDPGELEEVAQNRNPSENETEQYSLSTGFTFLQGIQTDVSIKESDTKDIVAVGQRFQDVSRMWPDLRIRIQKFKSFPLIKDALNKFITVFSPKTGFSRSEKKRYNIDGGFKVSHTIETNYNPLIQFNLQLVRSLSLSGSYGITLGNSLKYNQANGNFQSETKNTDKKFGFTAKYSFSAPGGISIPLFGKIKFKSTANFVVNVKFNSSLGETATSGKSFQITTQKTDFSIAPELNYQFSSQIRGGILLRWQDTEDVKRGVKTYVREIQIWTEIHF